MRRKIPPRRRRIRRSGIKRNTKPNDDISSFGALAKNTNDDISLRLRWSLILITRDQAYVISKKAEDVLSTVLADILEESLEDARNLAVTAGKSSVTREEMEKSLRNLCLRLSTVPAYDARIDATWNEDADRDEDSSSKVGRTRKGRS